MNLLKLAWRNVITNPLNLLLSVVLFALGIGLINFLLLLNDQLKDKFDKNLAEIDMVIGAKGSPLQMILCNMYHIDNPTGNISVKNAKPFLRPGHPLIKRSVPLSLGDSYKSFRIVGTNHSILELYNGEIAEGKLWTGGLEATIGAAVAEETGLSLGQQFVSSHGFDDELDMTHDHASFTVKGILKPTGSVLDQLILVPSAAIWEVHDHSEDELDVHGEAEEHAGHNHKGDEHHGHHHQEHDHSEHDHHHHGDHDHGGHHHEAHVHDNTIEDLLSHEDKEITSILVQFKSRTNFQALNMPRNINENTDLQAASPAIEINRLYSMIGVGTDAIRYLALLIAFVSGLSIFISLYKSMRERKYELSLMRVSGASRSNLLVLILLEGLILAVIGFVVGIVLSHVAMQIAGNVMSDTYRYQFVAWEMGKNELVLLGLSLVLGAVASIIPAIKAFKTDIHQTLSKG